MKRTLLVSFGLLFSLLAVLGDSIGSTWQQSLRTYGYSPRISSPMESPRDIYNNLIALNGSGWTDTQRREALKYVIGNVVIFALNELDYLLSQYIGREKRLKQTIVNYYKQKADFYRRESQKILTRLQVKKLNTVVDYIKHIVKNGEPVIAQSIRLIPQGFDLSTNLQAKIRAIQIFYDQYINKFLISMITRLISLQAIAQFPFKQPSQFELSTIFYRLGLPMEINIQNIRCKPGAMCPPAA